MEASPRDTDAINAALNQDWKLAIKINKLLISQDKNNLDATNRLAYAYIKTDKANLAIKTYHKVIAKDKYNHIANKNLTKLSDNTTKVNHAGSSPVMTTMSFIEEHGITKIATCINLAPLSILSVAVSGQEVFLNAKKRCVEIRDDSKTYLGALPDDISFRLMKLLKGGNQYQVAIKSVGKNTLTVLIRETSRGKKFLNQPSFFASTYSVLRKRSTAKKKRVTKSVNK